MNQATTVSVSSEEVTKLVAEAVANYNATHPLRAKEGKEQKVVTAEEIAANILKSRTSGKSANTLKSARKARKDAIRAEQEALGVNFYIRREEETLEGYIGREFTGFGPEGERLYSTFTDEVVEINPKGGATFAYRVLPAPGGKGTVVEFAVARCRKDEAFDPVIGKEQALKYFKDESLRQVRQYTPPPPYKLFDDIVN